MKPNAVQNERVSRHGTKRVVSPSQIHYRTSPTSTFRNLSMNNSLDSTQQTIFDETHSLLDVSNDEKICETASFILLESIRWLYLVSSFKNFFLTLNNELHNRFLINKYQKDTFIMLTEYTKNFKSHRLTELLMLLSNIQKMMSTISLNKIFFQHLINRISIQNLLHNIIHYLSTYFQ